MSIHPIETTEKLRGAYERYLKTIYPFQDENLREGFWTQLAQKDRLVKGPLLEASPPFETGRSIEQLVADGVLHPSFRELCDLTKHLAKPPLPRYRPLYRHQEQAIVNVVQKRRNLVVATGTGSGKTESFLIPIINHLMLEETRVNLHHAGVRSLLLYPMNALANDQLARLRVLLQNYPGITFGRYTGETLEGKKEAEERYLENPNAGPLLPNELHSREEMRRTPPHILLTNYAMLEYLLLRPQDTELFDNETGKYWRFVVIDEAHVYDGANGIEVAMLLRRLKDRVVQSQPGRLTCIATSATIGKGSDDFPKVAEFAENLFGEIFSPEDVFEASRKPVEDLGETWGQGSIEFYSVLHGLANPLEIANLAEAHGVPLPVLEQLRGAKDSVSALYALLRGDQRLQSLQKMLREQPTLLTTAAIQLFPTEFIDDAEATTVKLVDLAVRACPDGESLPLLPARYHVFARALEGAFACLNSSAHPDKKPRIYLNRHERCDQAGCDAQVFELATCSRCGIAYIVGEEKLEEDGDGIWRKFVHPLRGDIASGQATSLTSVRGGKRCYYILSEDLPDPNEDESTEDKTGIEDEWQLRSLCLNCGAIGEYGELPCNCSSPKKTVRLAPFDGTDEESMYCPSCSTRSRGVVYRLLTGKDAPVSVLATALYTELPPAEDEETYDLPGQGRKLLMFADSRQDAAFFAPYLENTFNDILQRRLILQALVGDDVARSGQLRLSSLSKRLLKQAEVTGLFSPRQDYDEKMSQMKTWLIREMTSWDFRKSLEGLGLLQFRLVTPPGWQPPSPLLTDPWNLSKDEVWALICLLLDTLRQKSVLTFPDGVDPRDEYFQPRNRPYYVSDLSLTDERLKRKYNVLGWTPRRGANARLDLLLKVLAHISPEMPEADRRDYAQTALTKLWDQHLVHPKSIWRDYMVARSLGSSGRAYQLDHASWEWVPSTEVTPLWQCSHCHNISFYSVAGICTTYGCPGHLKSISLANLEKTDNHYRYLYKSLRPAALRVEEHTAQWRSDEARKIQDNFIEGKVNALSCSTTFELGVDVGTLQAVLMRNVPPTTANYLQRAGRAGRRQNSAAFVLTFAQRRSHDLAYYRRPEKLVSGKVPTPSIAIRNLKIVERHARSVLIASFLRWCADNHNRFRERSEMKIGSFFAPDEGILSGTELLNLYLENPPEDVRQALLRIVPKDLQEELQIMSWSWLSSLTNKENTGILDLTSAQVLDDIDLYRTLASKAIEESTEQGALRAARYFRVLNTILGRDLLNFFGQRNILPKYGFPVDVVDFYTDHIPDEVANKVLLQRDLRMAISEYAPGGKVVAGKKVFTGGGLYKQPKKDWETMSFVICKSCGRFNKQKGDGLLTNCVACGNSLPTNVPWYGGEMLKPEFGFVARRENKLPSPGENPPKRLYASRVYFDDYNIPKHLQGVLETDHMEQFAVEDALSGPKVKFATRYSRYGQLVVVNHGPNGRGFNICLNCGFAEPAPEEIPVGNQRKRKSKKTEVTHKNPRTGRECTSSFMKVYRLGHDFITDVLEIQITGTLPFSINVPPDKNLWRSVLYALLEGASQAIGVRRNDLNGTLYPYSPTYAPAIVLYDDVPGGAGHVRRIKNALPDVFKAALERIQHCECGLETACHECLWNFYNQPYHDELARGLAIEFLQKTLSQKP